MKKILLLLFLFILSGPPPLSAAQPGLLVVGDSLSAGYGVANDRRWVTLLAQRLQRHCGPFTVINASVTGDTSMGGVSRLPALLAMHQPKIVIIELGGNDGLRGIGIATIRDNLQQMVRLAKEAEASVLLLGMRLPSNYGADFVNAFHQVYYDVAKAESVPLVPFFLQDVALDVRLMQSDGIHPNDEAQPIMLDNVWSEVKALVQGSVTDCEIL
ncbi:MAG: arylesterase [Candidatus Thiodiazotropha sp.]